MSPRWPLRTVPFWSKAPFFHLLLPLLIAIFCYDCGWMKSSPYWSVAGFLLLALLTIIVALPRLLRFTKALFFPALYLLVFCFGIWRTQQSDLSTHENWVGRSKDTSSLSLVRIAAPPSGKERIWRMPVSILKNTGNNATQAVCGEAWLNIYKDELPFLYTEGDELLVPAHWQEVANSGNPFEVDYKTINRRQNIRHQQFIAPAQAQLFRKGEPRPKGLLAQAHNYCNTQLIRYVRDSATYGLLQAMLLGDERSFDPMLRQAYSETGVIHIVSISGSHVGVLFAMIALLLSGFKGRKGSWLRFVTGLFVIWFYVLMAGAPPSALRAALMFSVLAFGTAFSKEPQPLNTLFAAAVALLCANPMWLFAVGFQLSFGAVLSLILFYEPIYSLWPQTNKALRWLWSGLAASFAAEVLTAPLVVYYFHNFPLFFMIANLLAAMLLGFLALLGGMLIIIFSFLPPLAMAVSWIVTVLVQAFNKVIIILQSWNPASFKYLQIDKPELLLLYLTITGMSLYFLNKAKRGLWMGMSSLLLLLAMLCNDKMRLMRQERFVVYNISRHTSVERIAGNHFQTLFSDTTPGELYASKLAHTGWGAWKAATNNNQDCFTVRGKRILVLKSAIATGDTSRFPTDILIVHCPLKDVTPEALVHSFQPKIIVAGGGQKRWVIQQWKSRCAVLHIPFHAVTNNGAFLIE